MKKRKIFKKFQKTIDSMGGGFIRKLRYPTILILVVGACFFMFQQSRKEVNLKETIEENTLAIYLEDEPINYIPAKDSGYTLDLSKSSCTNGVTLDFDYETWTIITQFEGYNAENHQRVKCSLYFKEKYYQISTETVRGGNITVTDSAAPGSFVTFTTNPSSTFTYYGARILNKNGEELLTLSNNENSFSMPEENVIIRPSWKKDDLNVLYIDQTAVTNWVIGNYEGVAPDSLVYISSRNYIAWWNYNATENSRYDMVSTTTFDVTDYETFYASGSVYGTTSANMYLYASIIPTQNTWTHVMGSRVASAHITSNGRFTMQSSITDITGNFYVGVQFLSGGTTGGAEFTRITLIGKIYS